MPGPQTHYQVLTDHLLRSLLCLSNNTNHLVAIWRPSAAEGRGEEPSLANSARPGVTKKEALELSA